MRGTTKGDEALRNTGDTGGRPVVLIGSLSDTTPGAIPTVTRAFMEGLGSKYQFVAHTANRRYGHTGQSALSPLNLWYFLKHLALWVTKLLFVRPDIAHYPVTSYWNMEKSLLFLNAAHWCGARTVGHLHGGAFLRFWQTLPGWRKRPARRALGRLSAFVVLSDGWREGVLQDLGLPAERIHVVHNPIDASFEDSALSIPCERAGLRILFLGALTPEKGLFELIGAMGEVRDIPSWHLTIAGGEREPGVRNDLQTRVRALGLDARIQILQGLWGEEKIAAFRESAVFVLPSQTENFPLVVLEAAAAGLPLVVTPVGAIPEFFEDNRSALIVPVRDQPSLALALRRILTDGALRVRLGGAARGVFVDRLSRRKVMADLDSVYAAVLSTSGRGGRDPVAGDIIVRHSILS